MTFLPTNFSVESEAAWSNISFLSLKAAHVQRACVYRLPSNRQLKLLGIPLLTAAVAEREKSFHAFPQLLLDAARGRLGDTQKLLLLSPLHCAKTCSSPSHSLFFSFIFFSFQNE